MTQSKQSRLQAAVEGDRNAQARFKEKVTVSEQLSGDLNWKGEVYVFHLAYNVHRNTSSKEAIAQWELSKPSSSALEAAEARGRKIKDDFQSNDGHRSHSMRKAKLAFAWNFDFDGADQDRIYVAVPVGDVKTAADAVKSVYAHEFAEKSPEKN